MVARNRTFKEEHPLGRLQNLPLLTCWSLACLLCQLSQLCLAAYCAEKRQAEAARIRDKYPDRIPVKLPDVLAC